MSNNASHFERHERTDFHLKTENTLKRQPKIASSETSKTFEKHNTKLKIAELRVLMFLLQYNLPFILMDALICLIKTVASDSAIAKDLRCGKGKAQYTTNDLLLEEGLAEMSDILRKNKFSLIIDETTDISTKKCLALVVRYFDNKERKVRDRFLAMLELSNFDAKSIHGTIVDFFDKNEIPLENLIGFASDNASVMTGSTGGVRTIFKKSNPYLFVMGCICHSLHLCSSAAVKCLPSYLEQMKKMFTHFLHTAQRGFWNLKSSKKLAALSCIKYYERHRLVGWLWEMLLIVFWSSGRHCHNIL